MTTAIGIFPAVMISWMAAETPLPQSHHLTEVARLRGAAYRGAGEDVE